MGCNHGKVSAPKPVSGTNTLLTNTHGQKDTIKEAAGLPEPAAVPLTGIFEGAWHNGVIRGDKMMWSDDVGTVSQLKIDEALRSIQFTTDIGKIFTGELQADGKIHWDDGDVWERCEAEPEVPTADVTAQVEEAAPAATAVASTHEHPEPKAKQDVSPAATEEVKSNPVPKPPLAVSHCQQPVPPAPDGSQGTLVPTRPTRDEVATVAPGSQQPRAQSPPATCGEKSNPAPPTCIVPGALRQEVPGTSWNQTEKGQVAPRREKGFCCC